MARGYAATELLDMVTGTLRDVEAQGRFFVIAHEPGYQRLWARRLLDEKRVIASGGYGVQRTLFDYLRNNTEFVGLYESGEPRMTDHLTSMTVDFVHARNHWIWDVKEADMNYGDREQLADIIRAREFNCMMGIFHRLEERLWGYPAEGSTKYPFGVPYYVTLNTTAGSTTAPTIGYPGFVGLVPATYSSDSIAGVDLSDHPHYKNYAGLYSGYAIGGSNTLPEEMDEAALEIAFESPVTMAEAQESNYQNYAIFSTKPVILGLAAEIKMDNDNLGSDIGYDAKVGGPTFRGHPIRYSSYLNANANSGSNPVYMLNMDTFFGYVLRNNYFRKTEPRFKDDAPDTMVRWIMLSYNWACVDRKANAVLAVSDPFTTPS